MAAKKPTPAQLRARENFAKMVRAKAKAKKAAAVSGTTKRKTMHKTKKANKKHHGHRGRVGAISVSTKGAKDTIMNLVYAVGGGVAAGLAVKNIDALGKMSGTKRGLIFAGAGVAAMEFMGKNPIVKGVAMGVAVYGGLDLARDNGIISGMQPEMGTIYLNGMPDSTPQLGYMQNSTPAIGEVPPPVYTSAYKSLQALGAIVSED